MPDELEKELKEARRNPIKDFAMDAVKILAVSAVLSFFGLARSCSYLPEKLGVKLNDIPNWQVFLLALMVGAGTYAGFKRRYFTSIVFLLLAISPEIYMLLASQGNMNSLGTMLLAKVIVFGGGAALGFFLSD